MIFGSLSEKEVVEITALLDLENVPYQVIEDSSVLSSNKDSLNYNLRYLHGPNLSNNILAIEVDSKALEIISGASKERLLSFGITDQIPEEFKNVDFTNTPDPIDLSQGQKKVVGINYGLCVLVTVVIFVLTYILKGRPMPW